eukprot:ANDGO_00580.mRNA.1 SPX and EXS domain-containing protein 5
MKFARLLADSMVPEWRTQYMDYKQLKKAIKRCLVQQDEAYRAQWTSQSDRFLLQDDVLHKLNPATALVIKNAMRQSGSLSSIPEAAKRDALHQLLAFGDGLEVDRKIDDDFQSLLEVQYAKVQAFYASQLSVCEKRIRVIEKSMIALASAAQKPSTRKVSQLRIACLEYYRGLQMLRNFGVVNFTGFIKILKKFDKYLHHHLSPIWKGRLENAPFRQLKEVDSMIEELKELYAIHFENGNKKRAADALRVSHNLLSPIFRGENPGVSLFMFGVYVGVSIILLSILFEDLIVKYPWESPPSHAVWTFNIYRGLGMLLGLGIAGAWGTYVWTEYQINYVFIFDLDARDHLNTSQYFEIFFFLTALFLVSIVVFVKTIIWEHSNDALALVPSWVQPAILAGVLFLFLFTPAKGRFIWWSSRRWMLSTVGRIVCAPFIAVAFRDFFIADQLTSITYFLTDAQYALCVLQGSPDADGNGLCSGSQNYIPIYIVSALPSWWRLMQCLRRYRDSKVMHPHLTNAIKYCSTIITIFFAALDSYLSPADARVFTPVRICWIISNLFSTSIKLYWDYWWDWSLFPWKSLENRKFAKIRGFYVFMIVENFILRFLWLATFTMRLGAVYVANWVVVLGFCEVIRRGLWNIVRVENEHVNNAEQFRAVKDIPVPFIQDIDGNSNVLAAVDNLDNVDASSDQTDVERQSSPPRGFVSAVLAVPEVAAGGPTALKSNSGPQRTSLNSTETPRSSSMRFRFSNNGSRLPSPNLSIHVDGDMYRSANSEWNSAFVQVTNGDVAESRDASTCVPVDSAVLSTETASKDLSLVQHAPDTQRIAHSASAPASGAFHVHEQPVKISAERPHISPIPSYAATTASRHSHSPKSCRMASTSSEHPADATAFRSAPEISSPPISPSAVNMQ